MDFIEQPTEKRALCRLDGQAFIDLTYRQGWATVSVMCVTAPIWVGCELTINEFVGWRLATNMAKTKITL